MDNNVDEFKPEYGKNINGIECNERFMQEQNDADDLNLITDKLIYLMEKQSEHHILTKLTDAFIQIQLLKKEIEIGTGNFKQYE